jgi:hypothetical protein
MSHLQNLFFLYRDTTTATTQNTPENYTGLSTATSHDCGDIGMRALPGGLLRRAFLRVSGQFGGGAAWRDRR